MSEPDYLQPDFDPNSLTIPKLRGILLEHNVDFSSSSKKAQLVDLFTEHITPKARRILDARSRVKASSRGIQDVGDDTTPAEESPRKRAVRRSARLDTADIQADDSLSRSRRSVSRRRTSGKHTRATDTEMTEFEEQQPPRSIRRTRRSSSRPSILPRAESPETPAPSVDREQTTDGEGSESVFSSHNPFQSGSSPAISRAVDKDRRKTIGSEKRRKSVNPRRRLTDFPTPTSDYHPDSYAPRTSPVNSASAPPSKYDLPLSRLKSPPESRSPPARKIPAVVKKEESDEGEDDMLEPGEEFTPEETREVSRTSDGTIARRRRATHTTGSAGTVWVTLFAICVGYFLWWRKEKIEIGYCGFGKLDMQYIDGPDWTNIIRPSCEHCPSNAICKPDFEVECKDDYVLVPHPFSLGGLIPLPPSCEPDSEKLRRIAVLSDEAIRVLRKRAADVECGELMLGKDEEKGVSEAHLRQVLYDLKAPSLSDAQFSELWRNALEEVELRTRLVRYSSGITYLRTTSLASVPLICAIRLSITGSVSRYRNELAGLILLFFLLSFLRLILSKNRTYQQQVTKLVHIALAHLAEQASIEEEPFIAIPHLRDQVLAEEFDPERRKKLWSGVQKVVELNSNVRVGEREVQGEVMRVWSWIGRRVATPRVVKEEDFGGRQWGVEGRRVIV
ncbi:inner nuclear membrane protein enriched at telomere/subtelomere region [Rhizina undulata]